MTVMVGTMTVMVGTMTVMVGTMTVMVGTMTVMVGGLLSLTLQQSSITNFYNSVCHSNVFLLLMACSF